MNKTVPILLLLWVSGAAAAGSNSVSLTPEEIEKMGVATTEAKTVTHQKEAQGFGVVMPHEPLAQAMAELRTAVAAEHQSHSALERSRGLAGTPGAMPLEVQETTERQAATDHATLELARQHLTSSLGLDLPWRSAEDSADLAALASGKFRLVRVTFPLGSVGDDVPAHLRLAHIDSSQSRNSWDVQTIWRAPADAAIPGRSFFAVMKGTQAAEGDHLLAWAPHGASESGTLIPAAAAVLSAGRFWCYVETRPGTFVRRELDSESPVAQGYFVRSGISPGEKVVTAAAGQLLARETNPATDAE